MFQKRSAVKALGVLTFSVLLILTAFDAPAQDDGGSRHTDVFHSAAAVFVPNRGQSDPRIQFYAQRRGASFWFMRNAAVVSLQKGGQRAELEIRFLDSQPEAVLRGVDATVQRVSYFIGNDRTRWQTDLPTYNEIVYSNLWPGIDLAFRDQDGALKYELRVAAGADVSRIRLQYRGAERVRRGAKGELVIDTALGAITDARPVSYQFRHGRRALIASNYSVGKDGRFGFTLGKYAASQPLVIDPGLAYSTFLGGSGRDQIRGLAVDSAGNAYVSGATDSPDFPFTGGKGNTTGLTVFVTKLNPTGTAAIYSVFFGGSAADTEFGAGIAVDAAGNAYIAGSTSSADFPTTVNAYDTTYNGPASDVGGGDVFFLKLNPTGTSLLYSTFLGGSEDDDAVGLALDKSGNVYITGTTFSTDFPVTPGAFSSGLGSGLLGTFVTKFNASGGLGYSAYVNQFSSMAIDTDSAGNVYLTGTALPGFQTTPGAYATTMQGANDIGVMKLNAAGSQLVYATLLPGSRNTCLPCFNLTEELDRAAALKVDAGGNAYVTGTVTAPDFPTTAGAFDTVRSGRSDAFVTKINPTGTSLLYSTLLSSSSGDSALGLTIDATGRAFVTGLTGGSDFPTTANAYQPTSPGGDAFVTVLDDAGGSLEYSTYLGGADSDAGTAIAIDAANEVYVAGFTYSADFPTTFGAYDTTFHGGFPNFDGFVTKLDPQLTTTFQSFAVSANTAGNAFELKGTFTLGATSDGINPVAEPVTLKVGDFSTVLPPGAFTQDKKGRYKSDSRSLDMTIEVVQDHTFTLKANGKGVRVGKSATVVLIIGNDTGTATSP